MLEQLSGHPKFDEMKGRLEHFGKPGLWPHVYNPWVAERLCEQNKVFKSNCDNAVLTMISAKDFVDFALKNKGKHNINNHRRYYICYQKHI